MSQAHPSQTQTSLARKLRLRAAALVAAVAATIVLGFGAPASAAAPTASQHCIETQVNDCDAGEPADGCRISWFFCVTPDAPVVDGSDTSSTMRSLR